MAVSTSAGKNSKLVNTMATADDANKKETSHSVLTYNHMENNFHLSNKKAIYYNMKIFYESIG
jgi:tubulin--tyrosine ligase